MLVKGHTLVDEGVGHDAFGRRQSLDVCDRGKCSCGELSGPLPSMRARRRWHRQHKAEIQAQRQG